MVLPIEGETSQAKIDSTTAQTTPRVEIIRELTTKDGGKFLYMPTDYIGIFSFTLSLEGHQTRNGLIGIHSIANLANLSGNGRDVKFFNSFREFDKAMDDIEAVDFYRACVLFSVDRTGKVGA